MLAFLLFYLSIFVGPSFAQDCPDGKTRDGCPEGTRDQIGCCPIPKPSGWGKKASSVGCKKGLVVEDGYCCWKGQGWGGKCIGTPKCPRGLNVSGNTCVAPSCPTGKVKVKGHCCWSGQVWSSSGRKCVGVPQCLSGWTLTNDAKGCYNVEAKRKRKEAEQKQLKADAERQRKEERKRKETEQKQREADAERQRKEGEAKRKHKEKVEQERLATEVERKKKEQEQFTLVEMPRLVGEAVIPYPEKAKQEGREGTVIVAITISETGDVIYVEVIESAGQEFDQAVVKAAWKFVFSPAENKNGPIPCVIPFKYRFVLNTFAN